MRAVYCFSATGRTRVLAEHLAQEWDAPLYDLDDASCCGTAVVVFPVYCQNIPAPVKAFLPKLSAERVALIAGYGSMGCGNVLWEAAKLVTGTVIAGACVPVGHTYRNEGTTLDRSALKPLLERIRDPRPVAIPRRRKSWLAYCFPDLRSRIGVRVRKTDRCSDCGLCRQVCPMGTKKCIRCLRCVEQCPKGALEVRYHPALTRYLRKKRQNDTLLYIEPMGGTS